MTKTAKSSQPSVTVIPSMTPDQLTAFFDSLELGYAPISGKPVCPEIRDLEGKNAGILIKIPTPLGRGGHGLIELIMKLE